MIDPNELALSPRMRGAYVLVGAAGAIAMNVSLVRTWHVYYRLAFPFMGALVPLGLFLVVTGATTEEIRSNRRARAVVVALSVAGFLAGLYANRLVGGR